MIAAARGRLLVQVSLSDVVGRVDALEALAQRALAPVIAPARLAELPTRGRLALTTCEPRPERTPPTVETNLVLVE